MLPRGKERRQDIGPRLVGGDLEVGAAVALAAEADAGEVGVELLQITPADLCGTRDDAALRFEALEFDLAGEWEGEFGGVEDLEDDDFVPGEAQVLDAAEHRLLIVEEVADEEDDAAAADLAGEVGEDAGDGGGPGGDVAGEEVADLVDLREGIGAGLVRTGRGVEDGEGDGVTLEEDEVGEARGDGAGVVELGDFAGAILHGLAAIEEEVGDEVRLLLVLLDVVAVAAAEDFPVEMPGVVAGDVFAMLRKLDGESAEGGAVRAGHVALDDAARLEPEVFGLLDGRGVEEGARGGGGGHGVDLESP